MKIMSIHTILFVCSFHKRAYINQIYIVKYYIDISNICTIHLQIFYGYLYAIK